MDKSVRGLWALVVQFYFLLVLAEACEVNGGQFLVTIAVEEEAEIGSVVGSLQFDEPNMVGSIKVIDSNLYFDYLPANSSFVVKTRIDVDEGLPAVQGMTLECISTLGVMLEIEVEFELSDINDFTPEFQPSSLYTFTISEAVIIDTQIALIEAKDRDIKNIYIEYELVSTPYSEHFYVKPVSGGKVALCLRENLDYESLRVYNLTMIAKDCQHRQDCTAGQRNTTAQITVYVTDADDLSPEFENSPYQVSIFEDSVEGTVVVQLIAKDQDELNAPIEYSISGAGSGFFSVNTRTGMVAVSDTAGMVRSTQYLLQAKAWQANDPTKRTFTSLVIKVVATNGNGPQFTESRYDVTLSESSPINTTAVAFHVTDRDTSGDFFGSQVSQLEFEIVESPDDFPFQLFVTEWNEAELKVAAPLDFERTRVYTLTLQVSDGEFLSKADAVIRILNDNDHNPEFVNSPYIFEIDWEPNAIVGVVQAVDGDFDGVGSNPVTYKVLSPYNDIFNINDNGEITLSGSINEYARSEYQLNVQAMDNGLAPRTTTTIVQITLYFPDSKGVSDTNTGSKNGDRLAIYIVAAIAGFLLIVVALLVMYFLKRKAKKTARHMRKDVDNCDFDKPYALQPTDTMNSSTDSQQTYQTQTTVIIADEYPYQGHLEYDSAVERSSIQPLEVVESDELGMCQAHSIPNNLSVVSDHIKCKDMPNDSNTNIPPVPATNTMTLKCSNDSGRSSLREDKSPYIKHVPFRTFLHPKSSSIDDSGNHSQDDEVALASFQRRNRGLHSHSNSLTTDTKSDILNVRATEGPPIRTAATLSQNSLSNSGYLAEVPEGFRTSLGKRTISPHSRTSDYESNTPTPEITYSSMIDYCADLPTQAKGPKTLHQRTSSYSDNEAYGSRPNNSFLSSSKATGLNSIGTHRSDTPCSEVSTESDSTATDHPRPQMTIYF